MTNVRVPSDATDAEIQRRLNQLYSKKDNQDNKQVAMKYVLTEHTRPKVYSIGNFLERSFN